MASRRIIFQVTGNKGGVGKSLASTAIIDCLLRHGHAVALAERDSGNNDAARIFADVIPIRLIGADRAEAVQQIEFLAAEFPAAHIVINSRAAEIQVDDGHGSAAFDDVAATIGARFICIWLLAAETERDGLFALGEHLKFYDSRVIVLHNIARAGALHFWQDSAIRIQLERQGGRLIVFPPCADYLRHQIGNFRRSPSWIAANGPTFLHKTAIAHWRNQIDTMMQAILING